MPSLYLSASLFTAAEQAFNRDLAAALRSASNSVFLPREIQQTQDQKMIFDLNLKEPKACELVLSFVKLSSCIARHTPPSRPSWLR